MSSRAHAEGFVAGLGFAALGITLYHILWPPGEGFKKSRKLHSYKSSAELYDGYIVPPLPDAIVQLLKASRLCFLATQAEGEPHLSLMNFTYYQKEEVIIMCTRRNTKKFEQMTSSNSVAVLIHDFPHLSEGQSGHNKTMSVTLSGVSEVCSASEEAKFRELHLKNNPDYSQFIVGEDIAVILIKVDRARMCDIKDRVIQWSSGPVVQWR